MSPAPGALFHILMLEDDPTDRQRLEMALTRDGLRCTLSCVQTRDDFLRELLNRKPDIIVADDSMPAFDGLTALRLSREKYPEIPFIFVSGTTGEELAVNALRGGATDYLVKGQLARFSQAVQRALQESRQREEKRKLEADLLQAQKMEALGRLIGGIAHDFNNLLTSVGGYSELLLNRLPPGAPMRMELQEIHAAGRRGADLIARLLAFSRKQVLLPRVVNLLSVARGLERLLRRIIGEHIELVIEGDSALPSIKVDVGQMEQILMNLAVNARDAMPDGGRIRIEVSSRPTAGPESPREVLLRVSDTGSGIEADVLPHIFEPFFTTKEPGKGTGLGLATVYGTVAQSGGRIEVDTAPGRGTTFQIALPACEPAPEPRRNRPSNAPTVLRGTETVLVVEDDDAVRKLAVLSLVQQGYNAFDAASGDAALALFQKHPDIRLLLVDVVLPSMSGQQLAARARAIRPSVTVVFMTGYSLDPAPVAAPEIRLLLKPFTSLDLCRAVREAFDGVRPT